MTDLHIKEEGTGPLLLLIHGSCTDINFYNDTSGFLARHFHVISYDRRGHGTSRRGSATAENAFSLHVEDAADLIRTHSPSEPAYVVGCSYGGAIALQLTAQYPDLIKRTVAHEPILGTAMLAGAIDLYEEEPDSPRLLHEIFALTGGRDPRARRATEEEMAYTDTNLEMFLECDLPSIRDTAFDPTRLINKDIILGCGEQSSAQTQEDLKSLAEKIDSPLRWFPGYHNGAFDLPTEFAAMMTGLLL